MDQVQNHLCDKFHLAREQVAGMLPQFLEALVGHMTELQRRADAGDLERLGRAGHTMKGALLNLGLDDCVDIAFEIERAGKAHDRSVDYPALLQKLRMGLGELLIEGKES
ncbi:MAG: Hpt domain-containing protein [Desulfopila sp.]